MKKSNAQIILDQIASLTRSLAVERAKSKALAGELHGMQQIYESGNKYVSDVRSEFSRIREEHEAQQGTINQQKHQIMELQERLSCTDEYLKWSKVTVSSLQNLIKELSVGQDLVAVAIRSALRNSKPNESPKINAIRYYREMTGLGLGEAKEIIDAAMK